MSMAACTLLGLLLSHQFIYRQFVIPRISEMNVISIGLWALLVLPPAIVWIATGYFARSMKELVLAGGVSALLVQIYVATCTLLDQPGFSTSLAVEAPGVFWTQGTVLVLVIIMLLGTLGNIAKWGTTRFVTPAQKID